MDPAKALALCESELRLLPQRHRHCFEVVLADLATVFGQPRNAVALMERVVESVRVLEGESYRYYLALVRLADKHYQLADYAKSIQILGAVSQKYFCAGAHFLLGHSHLAECNFGEARRVFEEAASHLQKIQGRLLRECRLGSFQAQGYEALQMEASDPHRPARLQKTVDSASEFVSGLANSPKTHLLRVQGLCLIAECLQGLGKPVESPIDQLKSAVEVAGLQPQTALEVTTEVLALTRTCGCPGVLDTLASEIEKAAAKTKLPFARERSLLASRYLEVGEAGKAYAAVSPLISAESRAVVQQFCFLECAHSFYEAGMYNTAAALFELGATPQRVESLFWRGMCYYRLGHLPNCAQCMAEFGAAPGSSPSISALKAQCCAVLADLAASSHPAQSELLYLRAAGGFSALSQREPRNPMPHHKCGVYLVAARRFAESLPWLQRALLLGANSALDVRMFLLSDLASCYSHLSRDSQAFSCYVRLLRLGGRISTRDWPPFLKVCLSTSQTRCLYRQLKNMGPDGHTLKMVLSCLRSRKSWIHYSALCQGLGKVRFQNNHTGTRDVLMAETIVLKKARACCLRLQPHSQAKLDDLRGRLRQLGSALDPK